MWELIQENKRKSWILFIFLGGFLILLGYVIGMAWIGPDGGLSGIFIALCLWVFLSLLSYFSGDSILLMASSAKSVSHDVHPQLFNVVEEMKIAASLPAMPKVYIIDSPALNAFATGRSPQKSSVAITAGLLSRLNRDELQGVIAHEMSHIMNRDVLYMTVAGVMLGSIVMLSEVFLRGIWYSSGSSRRYRSSSSGGGQAQAVIFIVGMVLAILAPIIARIFYFSLSRKREYLADACAVRLTRYPLGLASALEKISGSSINLESANRITAPMYIANPFRKKKSKSFSLFSTHPPAEERIKILKSMMQGVNYSDYQEAFSSIKGKSSPLVPSSALKDIDDLPIRKSTEEIYQEPPEARKTREVGDLIRALNKYAFFACLCGLKMKIPPNFKEKSIDCPRCGRKVQVPFADAKIIAAALGSYRQTR